MTLKDTMLGWWPRSGGWYIVDADGEHGPYDSRAEALEDAGPDDDVVWRAR